MTVLENRKSKFIFKRMLMLLLGCACISYGISLFSYVNKGVDPYSSMVFGLINIFNLSLGKMIFITNIILFLISIVIDKKAFKNIGIGTFINMAMIGFVADFFTYIHSLTLPETYTFATSFAFSMVAFFVFCLGISLYMNSSLGIAPYELLNVSMVNVSNGKLPFKYARVVLDCVCLVSSFVLGATIGANTLLLCLLTGFLANYLNQLFAKHVVKERW